MKRFLITVTLCFAFATSGAAQQTSADAPATKEDVQRYLDTMHSREMMAQMAEAMVKPMHQMIHEQYLKDKDNLPADFETRLNKMMDDTMKSFPWDEMLQAEVPVYQKHFTRGDMEALIVFYGSPTGKKMLKDMPAIMGETMQAMMPLLQKQMEAMQQRIQLEVAQMVKDSEKQATPGTKAKAN